jgi:transposase
MFYRGFSLEQRVRADHPLRKINQLIDFDFTYHEVAENYGINGNVSVPPPVILKLMLLLIFYNVRSERELMATIPERLDWVWFLGLDLDDPTPNHSVLSKPRARWGSATFKHFFERVVGQCVEAGLVDGSKIFMDSSLIQADASTESVINRKSLKRHLKRSFRELEARLDGQPENGQGGESANSTHVSATDPDASIVTQGKARSQLSYKAHRAVDERSEIITATEVTPGAVNEGRLLAALTDQHTENTLREPEVIVADSQYGTAKNYLECHDRGIADHIPSLKESRNRKGIFSDDAFCYDQVNDTYLCPGGNQLKRRGYDKRDETFEYQCLGRLCKACPMHGQCTTSKEGRTIRRHLRHDEIQLMREGAQSCASKRDIRIRQHLMERSFARAVRLGFKRARYRRLWRVQIQEYLTSTIQNIMTLMRYVKEPRHAMAMAIKKAQGGKSNLSSNIQHLNVLMPSLHLYWAFFLNAFRHYRFTSRVGIIGSWQSRAELTST